MIAMPPHTPSDTFVLANNLVDAPAYLSHPPWQFTTETPQCQFQPSNFQLPSPVFPAHSLSDLESKILSPEDSQSRVCTSSQALHFLTFPFSHLKVDCSGHSRTHILNSVVHFCRILNKYFLKSGVFCVYT